MEHRVPRDSIRELTSAGQVWVIAAKILRLWTIPSPEGGHYIKMILSDQERSRIGATITPNDAEHFDGAFIEGQWRFLFGFRVIPSVNVPKLSKHKYEIVLKRTTFVRHITPISDDIYLDTPRFEDIWDNNVDTSILSDLIGYVSSVGYLRIEGPAIEDEEPYILSFELTNENHYSISCDDVGAIAKRFYDQWEANREYGIVCVLRFWRFEEETGHRYSRKVVTSVAGCSDFLFNPSIKEATDFRTKFMLQRDGGSVIDP